MNDDQLCEQLANALLDEHKSSGVQAGPFAGRLSDVFKHLRGLNIPWSKILSLVGPIIQILLSGGDWQAVITAVLALFFPPHQIPAPP